MAIDSFPVSRVSSPLQRVLPVRESRAGTRHRIVVNYPAVFGQTDVKVTEGVFTFVALDEQHRPRPVDVLA